MIKKNPSYRITVTYYNEAKKDYESVIIEYPITCKFNSTRNTFSNSNKCTIDLYNLNSTTRTAIFKDCYVGDLDEKQWKFIKLEAGWVGNLSQIFYGRILQAYSSKSGGQTDIITHIDCLPFDIFNSQTSYTFEAGTSFKDAYKTMANDLQNCKLGNLGSLEGTFKTQTSYCGNTLDCINELTGGNTYVDNGVLNTLMSNEVIDIPVPLVTDNNGLLSTPIRRDATLTIRMLFEPTLIVGQLLEVKSSIQPIYNGQYKVLGFTHDCLISPTQAGQRITTVDLWIIPALTGSNINLTNEKVTQVNKIKGETITPIIANEPTGVYEVYSYIRKNNGKMPTTKITKNISWREMIGNNNTDAERLNECTRAILTNCYYTAQAFQNVIDKFFTGATVIINSGWRSKNNNTNCKGKPDSKHLMGLAIDFKIREFNTQTVYSVFRQVWNGFVGYYKKEDFIHIQVDSRQGISNDR